jgi:toxin YoeB
MSQIHTTFTILFDDATKKQLILIRKNKKLFSRLLEIFSDIEKNPYSPKFKFERLKHNLNGFCSKRLDKKNRVLYFVENAEITVTIVSLLGHYGDK